MKTTTNLITIALILLTGSCCNSSKQYDTGYVDALSQFGLAMSIRSHVMPDIKDSDFHKSEQAENIRHAYINHGLSAPTNNKLDTMYKKAKDTKLILD